MSGGGGVGGGDLNDLSGSSSGATPSSGGNSKRLSSKISRYGLTGGSFRERFGRSDYTNAILFRLFFVFFFGGGGEIIGFPSWETNDPL